jgi:tRNA dimethylallyltransferase
VPILVGGTGLYLRTLLDGIAPVPPIDPRCARRCARLPVADAYAALRAEDPSAPRAQSGDTTASRARSKSCARPASRSRTGRRERVGGIGDAVELFPSSCCPTRDGSTRVRPTLRAHVRERRVEEVRPARADCPRSARHARDRVPEIAGFLRRHVARRGARARSPATRNYAKRQYTWFRRQPPELAAIETENYDVAIFETLFRYLA